MHVNIFKNHQLQGYQTKKLNVTKMNVLRVASQHTTYNYNQNNDIINLNYPKTNKSLVITPKKNSKKYIKLQNRNGDSRGL